MITELLLGALLQVPSPPPPPLPSTGTVRCKLTSENGTERGSFEGELGVSEPRFQGKRYPTLVVKGEGVLPSGVYGATWTTGGGEFIFDKRDANSVVQIYRLKLVTATYKDGKGAIAGDIWSGVGDQRYFAGFCDVAFRAGNGGLK